MVAEYFAVYNWVGSGDSTDPYRRSFWPATLQGKARLFRSGLTCFNTTTGEYDEALGSQAELDAMEVISDFGGFSIVRLPVCSPEFVAASYGWLTGHQLFAPTLDALLALAAATRDAAVIRLESYWADDAWSLDPATAAIDLIDSLAGRASTVVDYYATVLNPLLGTPEDPLGLLTTGTTVSIAKCVAADIADQLSLPQRVADLAFGVVIADAATSALLDVVN